MTFQDEVKIEAAEQLAATHDLLLTDGWIQGAGMNRSGRCLVQAFYDVKHSRLTDDNNLSRQTRLVGLAHYHATSRMMPTTGPSMVQ
jgi:hypothetical protein